MPSTPPEEPTKPIPPGVIIQQFLDEFGWTQQVLADIMGRSTTLVNEIISGTRSITAETASRLGIAFRNGGQFWMDLESAYQLAMMKEDTSTVSLKAKLYAMAPVRDMIKRGWIAETKNMTMLERRVSSFLAQPVFGSHAARKTDYKEDTPSQRAWLARVRQLAPGVWAEPFSMKTFESGVFVVRELLKYKTDIRKLPKLLADMGIRFLIVEALPSSKIDGVCLWLDEISPVIAVSLRYDRIDSFWQTVAHELEHVRRGDGKDSAVVDIDIVGNEAIGKEQPESEKLIDRSAAEFLIPSSELEYFIARVKPLYSKDRIKGFANRINVHPGIVVGQLQHRQEIGFAHNRELLEKVRHIVAESSLMDGWGSNPIMALMD